MNVHLTINQHINASMSSKEALIMLFTLWQEMSPEERTESIKEFDPIFDVISKREWDLAKKGWIF